jgi:hypothetical protein
MAILLPGIHQLTITPDWALHREELVKKESISLSDTKYTQLCSVWNITLTDPSIDSA